MTSCLDRDLCRDWPGALFLLLKQNQWSVWCCVNWLANAFAASCIPSLFCLLSLPLSTGGQARAADRVSHILAASVAAVGRGLAVLPFPAQEPLRHPHAPATGIPVLATI